MTVESTDSKTDSRDRRRAPRISRESAAQLLFWPATLRTAPIDVKLVDYSSTGVGVVHNEKILIGQKFVLREPFVTHGSTCIYTVARCDKRADGWFIIGLHASPPAAEVPQEPEEADQGEWAGIAYLAFALIGAVAVVAMALVNR